MGVVWTCSECGSQEGDLHRDWCPTLKSHAQEPVKNHYDPELDTPAATSSQFADAIAELKNLLGSLQVQEAQMQQSALRILVTADEGALREVRGALKVYASVMAGIMQRIASFEQET
jgi:hypothetical protein